MQRAHSETNRNMIKCDKIHAQINVISSSLNP